MSEWRGGNVIGNIYVYHRTEDYKNRLGSGEREPRDKSLCLCVEHGGDCFYYYKLLKQKLDGTYTLKGARKFSSYTFPTKGGKKLSSKNYHLLMAGLDVKIM